MDKPIVTKIVYASGNYKPKPKVGDLKEIKGVLHRREFERTSCGAINKTGGRYHYIWVPIKAKEPSDAE